MSHMGFAARAPRVGSAAHAPAGRAAEKGARA
jgi:hypothetical protein